MIWAILLAVVVLLGWASWKKPRLTSSIVWSLTATVFGTAALMLTLPLSVKYMALWFSILTPVIWAAAMFWCHWDKRPYRPVVGLVMLTIIGAAAAWQIPPPA
ncbi:MAG: hypothetical protein AAGI27_15900 [Pseudomonadota bacterium]